MLSSIVGAFCLFQMVFCIVVFSNVVCCVLNLIEEVRKNIFVYKQSCWDSCLCAVDHGVTPGFLEGVLLLGRWLCRDQ